MILLIGIPTEPPLALARAALDARGTPYVLLNQRHVDQWRIQLSISGHGVEGTLNVGALRYPLDRFTGIYARPMDARLLPEMAGERTDSSRWAHCMQTHDVLMRWLELAPGRVLNRPSAMASNGSKPYQAQLIRSSGFSTPPTLISNHPDSIRAFQARHGRVIFKSISGARSIVTELQGPQLERLALVRRCPVQFQALIRGGDIRVHTVGSRVFAARAVSDAVDYRYATRQGGELALEAMDLPEELAHRCVALARDLGLDFAGIDLKLTPDGDAVCFEVNPCPAYSFYEQHTGQPIAAAVAAYLAGED